MNLLPGAPTVDAGYELTVYDSVKPVITQPAAAVIQLGSNGEGRAGACLGKGCLGGPACLGGPDHRPHLSCSTLPQFSCADFFYLAEAPWSSNITAVTAYLTQLVKGIGAFAGQLAARGFPVVLVSNIVPIQATPLMAVRSGFT